MTLIIYKKKNKVVNAVSLLRMLSKLENNCMHRVTIEAMKEPVILAAYGPELQVTIISK